MRRLTPGQKLPAILTGKQLVKIKVKKEKIKCQIY